MPILYEHILLATDLAVQSHFIGEKAIEIANRFHSKVSVLHVVETPVVYSTAFAEMTKAVTSLKESAEIALNGFLKQLKIPENRGHLKMGPTKSLITETAKQLGCDLIIVGSHGAGGFSHVLGSTASFILAEAKIDVLVINVAELKKEQLLPESYTTGYTSRFPGEELKTLHPNAKSNLVTDPEHQDRFGVAHGPKLSGSIQGVGQDTKRGPQLTKRPSGSPFKRPGREEEGEDDPNKK